MLNLNDPYIKKATEPPAIKLLEYSCPQTEVLETTADRVLFLAGVGSGKSQVIGVLSFDFVLNNPEVRGFIGANTYGQLSKSTLDRVKNVWETQFGLVRGRHYVENKIPPANFKRFGADLTSYENTICFENGAVIFVASLDNYQVIDGTEFGWAMLDETKDTKEAAVKEVILARLRQKGLYINPKTRVISKTMKEGYLGYNPLFIFTSPAKTKWLNEMFHIDDYADEIQMTLLNEKLNPGTDYFRKRTDRQLVVISSTWHNEKNLPAGYIQGLVDDLSHSEGLVDMLIYGSPFGKTGGEFITQYSRFKHVGEFTPWIDEAVHLSFDFNWVPYMTATCWQMKYMDKLPRSQKPGYLVRCFDEFCLPNPKNNCEDICREIVAKYERLLRNGLYYYGDYSGKNGSPLIKEYKDYYKVIEAELRRFLNNSSDRVIINQGLTKRRVFINKAFKGDYPFEIEIHKQCKELIGDLEFCKEGPDGGKMKETGLINGVKCQIRGHALDSMEYKFTSSFNTLFNA